MSKKLNKEIVFNAVCENLSYDGKGCIKYDHHVGFFSNLLEGEEGEFGMTHYNSNRFYGYMRKMTKISPERVEPVCPHFSSCGGCSLQHMNNAAQLKFKKTQVEECLRRIGGFKDVVVDDTVGMENPFHYRNKVQVPVRKGKNGKILTGFFRENSHDIVEIDSCCIENEDAEKIIKTVKALMEEMKIEPYDEETDRGIIRHILVRTSFHFSEVIVVLVCRENSIPGEKEFIRNLVEREPEIVTVIKNVNPRRTNVILGEKERVLYGKGYIQDELCGVRFHISAKSFYQVNPIQTERLYRTAIEYAELTGSEKVLDAYCGIGTIGMIASPYAESVVGVEIVSEAIEDAEKNAARNRIGNISFACQDAGEFLLERARMGERFDVVIMDPPRKGSDEAFLSSLIQTKPRKIVYISCNPSTLARDLKYLSSGYEIKKVTPFDMFAQTYHVETVVLLSRKVPDDYLEVNVELDDDFLTKAEAKGTYDQIKQYIYEKYKIKVSSLYIAQVKDSCGIKERENYNHSKRSDGKQPQVPENKRKLILEALEFYKMI